MKVPKKPTAEQIKEQVTRLQKVRLKVRRYNFFDEDNHAAIDMQVRVLKENLSMDAIHAICEGKDHSRDAGLDARLWLDGEGDTPASGWEEIAGG